MSCNFRGEIKTLSVQNKKNGTQTVRAVVKPAQKIRNQHSPKHSSYVLPDMCIDCRRCPCC